jgi:hypothetical protein
MTKKLKIIVFSFIRKNPPTYTVTAGRYSKNGSFGYTIGNKSKNDWSLSSIYPTKLGYWSFIITINCNIELLRRIAITRRILKIKQSIPKCRKLLPHQQDKWKTQMSSILVDQAVAWHPTKGGPEWRLVIFP